jgi:hypothetical protein
VITSITLYVTDPEASARFFALLGADTHPDIHLGLYPGQPTSRVTMTIAVPDIAAARDVLAEHGITHARTTAGSPRLTRTGIV